MIRRIVSHALVVRRKARSDEIHCVPIAPRNAVGRYALNREFGALFASDLISDSQGSVRAVWVHDQVDESRQRFQIVGIPTAADDQHFADAGVFGHIDAFRVVRADDRVHVESIGQVLSEFQVTGSGGHHSRQHQRESAGVRLDHSLSEHGEHSAGGVQAGGGAVRLAVEGFFLASLDLKLIIARELIVAQAVARERRVHDHQIHRRRLFGLLRARIVVHLLRDRGPGRQPRLPAQKLQRTEIGRALIDAEQRAMDIHPPELRTGREHPQRRRRHMRRGQIDVVTPKHVLHQRQRQHFLVVGVNRSRPLAQVADALGGRHQQRARAAGRIADAQPLHRVGVRPVAILLADRQRRQ